MKDLLTMEESLKLKLHIRFAVMNDLPQLAVINSMGTTEGKILAEERLPAFIEKDCLLVAERESEIVGLIYWKKDFFGTDHWFLTQITTADSYRRKGIAEMLLKHFLTYAREHHVQRVFADISVENTASPNLVKKLKGIVVGDVDLGANDKRILYRFDL